MNVTLGNLNELKQNAARAQRSLCDLTAICESVQTKRKYITYILASVIVANTANQLLMVPATNTNEQPHHTQ